MARNERNEELKFINIRIASRLNVFVWSVFVVSATDLCKLCNKAKIINTYQVSVRVADKENSFRRDTDQEVYQWILATHHQTDWEGINKLSHEDIAK